MGCSSVGPGAFTRAPFLNAQPQHWRARPPAVVNWHPYAHACGSGNNLTDYPVIEASFSLSIAEFDR
jgi:Ni,Fe-hydrogenase III large subunit